MHSRIKVDEILEAYNLDKISVASIASHSALDVFDGAKDEGFNTIAICQKGREEPYLRFDRVVDEVLILDRFSDIVHKSIQNKLRLNNAIIVPNRSFSVYVGYDDIEARLRIPVYGNRYLLRYEERTGERTYYRLLDEAGIRRPKVFKNPDEIDRPAIVKMPHAKKKVERGFFVVADRDDFWKKFKRLERDGIVDTKDLDKASIEELILGAHFNINYFNSISRKRVEILSIDRRIQTNLDGILRLPAEIQLELKNYLNIEYVEIGHEPATVRERMLTQLFRIGDKFVEAARKIEPPGIIGPFTLQLMITPDLNVVVFDVALRIGGGTNIYLGIGSQYSKLYFGAPISMGRRIAIELRECIENNCITKILT